MSKVGSEVIIPSIALTNPPTHALNTEDLNSIDLGRDNIILKSFPLYTIYLEKQAGGAQPSLVFSEFNQ